MLSEQLIECPSSEQLKMKMMPSHDDDNTVYDFGDVDEWDDQNAIRAVN